MFRKISETFTATHFTILAAIAMLVPGAVFATVATTAVSITDPNTGQKSFIDATRRLAVYDATAGFANSPSNYVKISGQCVDGTGKNLYKIPAGKALIIKSVNVSNYSGASGADNGTGLYDLSDNLIADYNTTFAADSGSFDFGNGFYMHSGSTLQQACTPQGTFNVIVTGYLVPAGAVPAVGSPEDAQQSVSNVSYLKGRRRN